MKLERYDEKDVAVDYLEKDIDTNKLIVPTHFTCREGGSWIPYIGHGWTLEDLDNAVIGIGPLNFGEEPNPNAIVLEASQRGKGRGEFKQRQVHALAFADPAFGSGNFARWDVVNGWTTPLPELK